MASKPCLLPPTDALLVLKPEDRGVKPGPSSSGCQCSWQLVPSMPLSLPGVLSACSWLTRQASTGECFSIWRANSMCLFICKVGTLVASTLWAVADTLCSTHVSLAAFRACWPHFSLLAPAFLFLGALSCCQRHKHGCLKCQGMNVPENGFQPVTKGSSCINIPAPSLWMGSWHA